MMLISGIVLTATAMLLIGCSRSSEEVPPRHERSAASVQANGQPEEQPARFRQSRQAQSGQDDLTEQKGPPGATAVRTGLPQTNMLGHLREARLLNGSSRSRPYRPTPRLSPSSKRPIKPRKLNTVANRGVSRLTSSRRSSRRRWAGK